ncbi:MAG: hypothetical protein JSS91_05550 [Bacteroidetes bacterium]|nr:hypothetical protein [Bacteroidota bacterium]
MKTFYSSPHKVILLTFIFLFSLYLISEDSHPFLSCQKEKPVVAKDSIVPWRVPELSAIPDNEEGKQIRLGMDIFNNTYKYIGPEVNDVSKRFAGNDMVCQNCHFKGGTLKNVLGLVGVYSDYPELDPRSGKDISLSERINNCLKRSMNGNAMPDTCGEMNALITYLKWLSTYAPKGTKVEGQGLAKIELLNRAADTAAGRIVFLNNCTTCHAENGGGVLRYPGNVDVAADSMRGYKYPPVMGMNSYNDGAGMYRLLASASFIFAKMPYNDAILTVDESYDVAAFINSAPRPKFPGVEKDYPDLKYKPVDFPFPPFDDNFSASQHKYGPYQQMIKEGETSKYVKPM